ncbi:MAG: CBS domain-containing protein [Deferribacterota bacterium]|nr:CBS domain-containing protein [Deferribacterota bacterium]
MKIVLTHLKADFDALASAFGAFKLYNCDYILLDTDPESNVKTFLENEYIDINIKRFSDINLSEIDNIDLVVITDCKYANRLGNLKYILPLAKKVILYDHHPDSGWDIAANEYYIEKIGATTTLVVQELIEKEVPIDEDEASFFLLGIYEDTGFLTFYGTTPLDLKICSKLLELGANINLVSQYVKKELTKEQINILNELINNLNIYRIDGILISYSHASHDEYVEDVSYLTHRIMDIENLDCIFVFVRSGDRIFFVARSNDNRIDVSKVAEYYGGGGHPYAASATIKDMTLQEALERFKLIIKKALRFVEYARDLMTSPAVALEEDFSFEKALDIFTKYNFNTMPVVKDSKVIGIVTRQDILQGIKHGINKEPIKNIMQVEFDIVTEDTPYYTVENIIIGNNQKLVPVVKDDRLIGVITRVDLLRMFQSKLAKNKNFGNIVFNNIKIYNEKNVASIIKNRYGDSLYKIFIEIGELADKLNINVYLVGGFVRDLLLNYLNLDVDIVVEGNAILLAKRFAKIKNAKIHIHDKFKTAVVLLDGLRIDFATSRTEYYDHPGAFPIVEFSSIKRDLFRRDFTINAMAIQINKSDFGKIIDYYGGLRDIADKKIRVLHNLSFIEDPTRGIRAIRFAIRYKFDIGKHTTRLLKNAVDLNLFSRVPGSRFWYELRHLLEEDGYLEGLKLLDTFKILPFIHEKITIDEYKIRLFSNLSRIYNWYTIQFKDYVELYKCRFAILINELKFKDVKRVLKKFQFPKSFEKEFLSSFFKAKSIYGKLKRKQNIKNSEVFFYLRELNIEYVLFISALMGKDFDRCLKDYLTKFKDIKLEINGNDLIEAGFKPSKLFGVVLDELLKLKIDGKIKNKSDELSMAKILFEKFTAEKGVDEEKNYIR